MNERIFNEMAKRYDNEQRRHLAGVVVNELEARLDNTHDKTLLDYGAGTGLVGLELVNSFKRSYLLDGSEEMVEIMNEKMEAQKIENAEAYTVNLLESDIDIKTDVIILSLVLLHVSDQQKLIQNLYNILNDNGEIYIIDFDKNHEVSHPKVTNGFTHEHMKDLLTNAGFKNHSIKDFYQGKEIFMKKDATLFIASSKK